MYGYTFEKFLQIYWWYFYDLNGISRILESEETPSPGLYSYRTIGHGSFTSLKSYKIRKIFNPMAINKRRISLTNEKLHFLHYSVREVIYALIDVLGQFSVILQP